MGLGRYEAEVRGIADELAELLDDCGLRDEAEGIARKMGFDALRRMDEDEYHAAVTFLGKTPGQRDKYIAKKDDQTVALLILRARYLGLKAEKALQITGNLESIPGSSYRNAAMHSALVATRVRIEPDLDDVLASGSYGYRF